MYRGVRTIRTIDKEQLKQIKHLKNEIEVLKKQIADLDYTITTDSVKGSSPYFPYTEHSIKITGIDHRDYNSKLARLERKLNRRIDELTDLIEETYESIENIGDSLIRQIITLRYVNGLTWDQVAAHIGGNNTADSVRMMCNRFLN